MAWSELSLVNDILLRSADMWLVMLLESHETYANAKSLVDLLHLR